MKKVYNLARFTFILQTVCETLMRSVAGSVVSHPYLHHLPVLSFVDFKPTKGDLICPQLKE